MKYHALFAIICATVAIVVDYERQGRTRGLAFGELEVSSYVVGSAPRIFGFGANIAHGDLQLTDVVPLRGALVDFDPVEADITFGGSALMPPEALQDDRASASR